MSGGIFAQHKQFDSPFQRLDARAKILGFGLAVLIVASVPPGTPRGAVYFLPVVLALILASRVPLLHLLTRLLAASPLILAAAASAALAGSVNLAESVLLKAYFAVALLTLLGATTSMPGLLAAFRRLGAPDALNMTAGLMLRYVNLLAEEHRRLSRARSSRVPAVPLRHRFSIYGKQIGLLLIRSWERAERIHSAMVARGFAGTLPVLQESRFTPVDAVFVTITAAVFLTIRIAAA